MDRSPTPRPVALAPLSGREHDLIQLVALLQGGVKLLTLRGPGGIGKTALAQHLARRLTDDYDHVQFIDLSAVRVAEQVANLIVAALPAADHAMEPGRLMREFTAGRRTVLVLDNFEQVLPAAALLGEWLASTEHLQLVVTSRVALHLHDEHDYLVGPLSLPLGTRDVLGSAAVQVFVARVQAVLPTFTLNARTTPQVMRLCELLEGVPLALELAAVRTRSYSLGDLLVQLEHPLDLLKANFQDRPERLRSLRAAVEWSYNLLDEQERAVFECCAVFKGSFTPQALTAVWGSPEVLGQAESLLEQSFLHRLEASETLWKMLEPLRELAYEHLAHNPLTPTWHERHALYFLAMLDGHDRSWAQNTADHRGSYLPHYPNIRAGMVWAIEQGRNDLAYRYLGSIRGLWMPFGLTIQELPLVEEVLALPAPGDRTVLLRALENSADCLQHSGQPQASEACLHDILALCRELGDGERAAWAKLSLAGIKREAGLGEQALKIEEQVLQDFATRGEDHLQGRMHRMLRARTRLGLALSLLELGRSEQALESARLAEEGYRKAGNKVFELESRLTIGYLQLELHQRAEGQFTLLACLNEAVEAGLRGVAEDIFRWGLPLLAAQAQDWSTLIQFAAFVDDPALESSQSVMDRQVRHNLLRAREAFGEVAYQQAWMTGTQLRLSDVVALATHLAHPQSPPVELPSADLTPREWEVLALVSQGHPDRRVARLLGISPGTASKHVSNLLGKLGLRNRVELARWAIEHVL